VVEAAAAGPARYRLEVRGRIAADGSTVEELNENDVLVAARQLVAAGIQSIAICFINSYRNSAHEQRAEALIRAAFPDLLLCASHAVLPEMKEYERTSTTVVNAYLLAQMRRYLQRLESGLRNAGISAPVLVMTSNGGRIAASTASEKPVLVVASGPAGGVVGGSRLAQARGEKDTIVFDMGGTTAKAVIIEDGQPSMTSEYEFRDGISTSSRFIKAGGYMLKVPAIDIAEVGAGGGSLASIDHGGLLRVGPESAGADPGPACYSLGNDRPTVTDANVVLGYISPTALAGGRLPIDRRSRRRPSRPTLRARSASASKMPRTASGRLRMPPWGAPSVPSRSSADGILAISAWSPWAATAEFTPLIWRGSSASGGSLCRRCRGILRRGHARGRRRAHPFEDDSAPLDDIATSDLACSMDELAGEILARLARRVIHQSASSWSGKPICATRGRQRS
jgi:N-methylhydantoinase A/oxoprolinase/acetone carboxylase beta subunit